MPKAAATRVTFCLKWRQDLFKNFCRERKKLRVARVARNIFSNKMFCDLRKYSRGTLLSLTFRYLLSLVASNVAACSRVFELGTQRIALLFVAAFPGNFLGPILLIMQVDCRRTSVAAFFVAVCSHLRDFHDRTFSGLWCHHFTQKVIRVVGA